MPHHEALALDGIGHLETWQFQTKLRRFKKKHLSGFHPKLTHPCSIFSLTPPKTSLNSSWTPSRPNSPMNHLNHLPSRPPIFGPLEAASVPVLTYSASCWPLPPTCSGAEARRNMNLSTQERQRLSIIIIIILCFNHMLLITKGSLKHNWLLIKQWTFGQCLQRLLAPGSKVLIGHTVSCNAIQSTGTCPLGWQIAQIGQKIILLLRSRWVKMGQEFSAVCDPKSCDTVTRFSSSTLFTLLPVPADVWLCFSAMHWALDQLFSSLLLFAFSSSSQHLPVHRKTGKTQSVWRKAAPLPLYNL